MDNPSPDEVIGRARAGTESGLEPPQFNVSALCHDKPHSVWKDSCLCFGCLSSLSLQCLADRSGHLPGPTSINRCQVVILAAHAQDHHNAGLWLQVSPLIPLLHLPPYVLQTPVSSRLRVNAGTTSHWTRAALTSGKASTWWRMPAGNKRWSCR